MRRRIFHFLANICSSHPWIVIGIALLITMISAGLSSSLKMETRVLDLVPASEPCAQEYNDIIRQYNSASQIIIGIKGDSRQEMISFAEDLEKQYGQAVFTDGTTGKQTRYIKRITISADTEFIREHGLMLLKKRDLENTEELFRELELAPLLTAYNDFLEKEYIEDSGSVTEREKEDSAIASLKSIVNWLRGLEDSNNNKSYIDLATDRLVFGEPYLFSEDDSMLLALVTPSISIDRMEETMEGAKSLRTVVNRILKQHPSLKASMTGMPMLTLEEGESVFQDMELTTLLSLIIVLGLFVVAFRMWTAPLLAMLNLIFGIIWTSGFVAVAIGRLNLFTLMFAVILIGLGIDFAIHLNAAFSTARSEGKGIKDSIQRMFQRSGAGVVTGAFTTAAGFLALSLTNLDALVELGVVLGAGILFTLLGSLTVLPAMYAVHSRLAQRFLGQRYGHPKPVRLTFPFLATMGDGISRRPMSVIVVFLMLTAYLGYASREASFEPDMLEIEPVDMPSVVLHREVIDRFELHPDYTMFVSKNPEQVRPLLKKLKQNRLIGRVDAITEYVPSEEEQRRRTPIVERIRANMRNYSARAAEASNDKGELAASQTEKEVSREQAQVFLEELDRLQMNIQELGQLAFTSMKQRLYRTCNRLSGGENPKFSLVLNLKETLKGNPRLPKKMADYQRLYIPWLASKFATMANTTPITIENLPESIKGRYLSSEGNNLVTIYSSVDLWKEGKTDLFLKATQKVSERITGTPILLDRLIKLIASKGLMATLLALGTVFVILIIDFRSLRYAILGMIPLLAGFTWMVGSFVLLGKKFDVVNVEAIPLILGIGIDDAVHILHAVKRQGSRALSSVLKHTGRALLLTSLTTGIAFGSIAFASHRGLAGMGLLLVLGVVSCFITSIVFLPALVRIFLKDDTSLPRDEEV